MFVAAESNETLLHLPDRMTQDAFADATLVVLGHGTTQNEDSAAPVYQHVAELRRRKIFADVREAFWKQEPQVKPVLAGISAPRVFIVPLFISEGYFASEVIPRELGLNADFSLQTSAFRLVYCRPIGTHDSMTCVLLARAREVVEQFPFPRAPEPKDITLFIAGHGTERSDKSRKAIERQVELLRAQNLYAGVHAIFLEESPRIADCYQLSQTRNIVIVPFFISDGLHTREDIPVLLGEPKQVVQQRFHSGQPTEKNGKLVWYSAAIGSEPHIADVILERVREAAATSKS
jgi:sirohydrochlorin cobaltochelatase